MSDLAAHHILALTAYEPGKPEDELRRELGLEDVVKLASNENPYGPSPKAVAAVSGETLALHRYPDPRGHELREALGDDPGCELRAMPVHDSPADALVDASRSADLVVVGSRGHSVIAGLLLGSVSEHLVHHAEGPVTIVR